MGSVSFISESLSSKTGKKHIRASIPIEARIEIKKNIFLKSPFQPEIPSLNHEIKCFCCQQTKLTFDTFECGHIIPYCLTKISFDENNMHAICKTCNRKMHRLHMFVYMILNKKSIQHLSPIEKRDAILAFKKYFSSIPLNTQTYFKCLKSIEHYNNFL